MDNNHAVIGQNWLSIPYAYIIQESSNFSGQHYNAGQQDALPYCLLTPRPRQMYSKKRKHSNNEVDDNDDDNDNDIHNSLVGQSDNVTGYCCFEWKNIAQND